jgi:hypothetical protein
LRDWRINGFDIRVGYVWIDFSIMKFGKFKRCVFIRIYSFRLNSSVPEIPVMIIGRDWIYKE